MVPTPSRDIQAAGGCVPNVLSSAGEPAAVSPDRRGLVLVGLFVGLLALTVVILFAVLGTVFFAITIAYVLLPVRTRLAARGFTPRLASGVTTAIAFVSVLLMVLPIGIVLYVRRMQMLEFLRNIPASVTIRFGEFAYVLDASTLFPAVSDYLQGIAFAIAKALPVIALKLVLFGFLVFALLFRPEEVRSAVLDPVPPAFHDIAEALHERVRATLFTIYVVQVATAVGTFLIALPVFSFLGYSAFFSLSVVAGVLQFLPVIGPSLLVAALALFQLSVGNATAAALVAVLGTVLIGFLPDALIRPRLAALTGSLPASLYFVGFTGGVLSVGAIGVIAGPLVIALLVEVVELHID